MTFRSRKTGVWVLLATAALCCVRSEKCPSICGHLKVNATESYLDGKTNEMCGDTSRHCALNDCLASCTELASFLFQSTACCDTNEYPRGPAAGTCKPYPSDGLCAEFLPQNASVWVATSPLPILANDVFVQQPQLYYAMSVFDFRAFIESAASPDCFQIQAKNACAALYPVCDGGGVPQRQCKQEVCEFGLYGKFLNSLLCIQQSVEKYSV